MNGHLIPSGPRLFAPTTHQRYKAGPANNKASRLNDKETSLNDYSNQKKINL